MILASQQLFEYYGNSFKSSPNPCELEHVNPTFIWCLVIYFPSWWSKEEYKRLVELLWGTKKKEDSSGVRRWKGGSGVGRFRKESIRSNASISPVTLSLNLLWRYFPPKKQFLGLFPEPGTPPTQVLEKKYSKNLHLRYYLNIWYKNLQVVIMEFCWLLSIVNFCQQ